MTAPFAAEVGRYLADCAAYARVLSPAYHPTADSAVKVIFHRGADQAGQIRAAFLAAAGGQPAPEPLPGQDARLTPDRPA